MEDFVIAVLVILFVFLLLVIIKNKKVIDESPQEITIIRKNKKTKFNDKEQVSKQLISQRNFDRKYDDEVEQLNTRLYNLLTPNELTKMNDLMQTYESLNSAKDEDVIFKFFILVLTNNNRISDKEFEDIVMKINHGEYPEILDNTNNIIKNGKLNYLLDQ